MPIYEYECPVCGARMEFLQKLGAAGGELKCRSCGHQGLNKLVSGALLRGGSGKNACAFPAGRGKSGFA
ncbi:MAG: zinc ribbon domain-containing protein [Deltaproteobacteria bacterium]|nr:zinc ribbon domain-containing protein [Deltaproteobacteria bacterium]